MQMDNISYTQQATFEGLPSGTYTLYVKDANNCTKSTPIIINSYKGMPPCPSLICAGI